MGSRKDGGAGDVAARGKSPNPEVLLTAMESKPFTTYRDGVLYLVPDRSPTVVSPGRVTCARLRVLAA